MSVCRHRWPGGGQVSELIQWLLAGLPVGLQWDCADRQVSMSGGGLYCQGTVGGWRACSVALTSNALDGDQFIQFREM